MKRHMIHIMAILILVSPASAADPDLAFISPTDAMIVRLNLADTLATELGKKYVPLIAQIKGIENFEKVMGFKIEDVHSVTMAAAADRRGLPDEPRFVVRLNKAFKLADLLPDREKTKFDHPDFKEVYKAEDVIIARLDDRRFLVVPNSDEALKFVFPKDGPLASAIESIAAGSSQFVIGFNPEVLTGVRGDDPIAQFAADLRKNKLIPVLELRADQELKLALSLTGPDADAAKAGGKLLTSTANGLADMIKAFMRVADQTPEAAKAFQSIVKSLEGAKLSGKGKTRTLTMTNPADPASVTAILLPYAERERMMNDKIQSRNHLVRMELAVAGYAKAHKGALPGVGPIPAGKVKPGLSWRVAILPFIEQGELYKQFKLDEPWDSEHNKKLIPKMPEVFVIPASDEAIAKAGKTYYRMFDIGREYKINTIPDGTSNTICVVEAAEPVEWTKPDGLDINAKDLHALIRWGWEGGTTAFAVLYDGSVKAIRKKISAKTLKDAVTPDDGNPPGDDFDR